MHRRTWARLTMLAVGLIFLTAQASFGIGIVDTKHNLRSSGTNTIKGDVDEICVFCHTPHHAQGTAVANGPLWNRTLSSASYTIYDSPTLDATPSNPPLSVSKACLSCHDGTIGINQMANRPGSGLGTNPDNGTDTKITGPATLIGTNLADDHPISMAYASASSPGTGGTLGEDSHTAGFRATTAIGSRTVIQNGSVTLPLYSGNVECASCHDPHESRTFVDSVQVAFLRTSNAGSALCTSCHLK